MIPPSSTQFCQPGSLFLHPFLDLQASLRTDVVVMHSDKDMSLLHLFHSRARQIRQPWPLKEKPCSCPVVVCNVMQSSKRLYIKSERSRNIKVWRDLRSSDALAALVPSLGETSVGTFRRNDPSSWLLAMPSHPPKRGKLSHGNLF